MARSRRGGRLMRGQDVSRGFSHNSEKRKGKSTVQGKPAHGVSLWKRKAQAFDIMVDLLHTFEGQLLEAYLPSKCSFGGAVIQ